MNSGDEARYWYAKGREDGRAERSRLLAAAVQHAAAGRVEMAQAVAGFLVRLLSI